MPMKKQIHPEMRDVVFVDTTTGDQFLIRSTVSSAETVLWEDGNHYPVVKVEISSRSHPAFKTGDVVQKPESTRAEKFRAKFSRESIH
jgi:large subunit ribosomal protein L31